MKRRNFIFSITGFFAAPKIAVNLYENDVLQRILKKGKETIDNYKPEIKIRKPSCELPEGDCCLKVQKKLDYLVVRPYSESNFIKAMTK